MEDTKEKAKEDENPKDTSRWKLVSPEELKREIKLRKVEEAHQRLEKVCFLFHFFVSLPKYLAKKEPEG